MAPFKFPPPPPPPPKASNDAPNTHNSQMGGPGRGRGDRGRGRGGSSGRGRGHHQGNTRGGYQHGGHRSGQQQNHGGRGAPQNYGASNGSYQQQQQPHVASQTYGNTNFAPVYPNPALPNPSTNSVPPLDPGALVQAMAFMATPAGMQTMAAFANHMASGNVASPYGQPVPPQQPIPQSHSSPPHPGSKKRKRGERAAQWQQQHPHQTPSREQKAPDDRTPAQKPPRAKVNAAPSVPGFGFSLPVAPAPKPQNTPKAAGRSNNDKRCVNLGLTRMIYDEESSNDEAEDVDEEAVFAAKWDGQGIAFEHNGEMISLQTAADLAEFIKDRRKNFPTQEKIAEKAQKATEKRASELDFLRKVKGKLRKEHTTVGLQSGDRHPKKHAKKQSAPTKPNLDELRQKVKDSTLSKHRTPVPPPGTEQQSVDLGLGYDTDTGTEPDDDSSILSESSVVSSSDDSASGPDSDVDGEDSDAPPEAQSSKVAPTPVVPPPPPQVPERKIMEPSKANTRICKQWKETGKCKYKYCRYKHAEEEPKRVGLYEKMVEQELEKADRLVLEAIKYLGQNGFLG